MLRVRIIPRREKWGSVSGIFWCCRRQSDRISRRCINLQDCAALCMHLVSLMIVLFPGPQYVAGLFSLRWSHMSSVISRIRMRCVRAMIARHTS